MLKNPFNRYKLCVGGSGEAGFSSGGSEPDSSYDSGSGSVSSNPGVSTSLESQAAAQAEANAAAGYSAFWSNPANTPAGRELAATRNTQANPVNNDSGNTVNPYNPLTEPGRYSNFQNANPSATVMSQKAAMAQIEPTRPGYTPMMGLGDTKTQELMRGGYTASQSLLLQMEQAKITPALTDDRYYANEYQKSVQNIVELSSGEHARGMQSGLPTGPNLYEYSGDLALGLLKGVQGKSGAQTTTPVNLDVLGGSRYGAQNISWTAAIRGEAPNYSELRYGTDVLARAMATGEMGPYGELRSYSSAFGVLPLAVQQQIGYTAGMSAQRAGIGWDIDISKLYEAPTESGMRTLGYGGKYSPIGEVAPLQGMPLQSPGLGSVMGAPIVSIGNPIGNVRGVNNNNQNVTPTQFGAGIIPGVAGFGFGVQAANEGVNDIADYSTPTSIESGMNYGLIQKPFMGGDLQPNAPVGLEELLTNKAEYSGGILGQFAFGKQAPQVIKGYVGSVVDFGTSLVGWTPFKNQMQQTDSSLSQFRTDKAALENATPEVYNRFLENNVTNGTLVRQAGTGTLIENPNLTYDYGEYTKWGIGAGNVVKSALGITDAQLNQYQFQLEQKKGIEYIPEKLVFGAGATLSTHPEKIATAFGAGAVMILGGEAIGGAYAATTLPARAAAFGLAHPTAATVGSGIITYGIPLALGGATYYGASEGLTATSEHTTINLGGMIPELGGLVYGGASARLGIRAIDVGYVGFGAKPVDIKMATRDLTAEQFNKLSLMEKENYNIYGSTTPTKDFFAKVAADRHVESAMRSPPIKVGVNVEPSMTSFERSDILNRLSKSQTPVVQTPQQSLSAGRKLLEGVPEVSKPIDIGEAALRFGPAGEKPTQQFVGNPTGRVVEAQPTWDSAFRAPTVESKLSSQPTTLPKTQLQPEPLVSPAVKPYKQPIDVQKLNTLSLNSIPEAKVVSKPTYSELRAMGYDWNIALRMSKETTLSTVPTIRINENVTPIPKTSPSGLPSPIQQTSPSPSPSTRTKTSILPSPSPSPSTAVSTATAFSLIQNPAYEREPEPQRLYVPSFSPDTRTVTEKKYVPFTEPANKPITEKTTIPEIIPEIRIPIIPRISGGFPFGSGGGGGSRTRKRRKVELFSFEMGEDTPIPTRYGLAGQTTQYIPGTRGIAVNILNPADIAPNSLLTIGRRSQEDRL